MDNELIKKSKKGDIEAFEKLIAENISPKALVKAFESIEEMK